MSREWRLVAAVLLGLAAGGAELALLTQEPRDVEAIGKKPLVVHAFGEGLPVAQTFTMTRDGLEHLAVRFWTGEPATLLVQIELLREHSGAPGVFAPQSRSSVRIDNVSGAEWRTFDIPPVPSSNGGVFELRLQLLGVYQPSEGRSPLVSASVPVGLMAWADNPLRSATLIVDGQEQWGDLAFAARGAGRTRYTRMLAGVDTRLPAWAHVPITLLVLIVLDVALASVAHELLSHRARADAAATAPGTVGFERGHERPDSRRRARRLATAVAVVAAASGAVGWALHHGKDDVVVDLMGQLDEAVMDSPMGLHGAFEILDIAINGQLMPAIFAHPPSKITWRVDVPACASLKANLAIVPGVWEQPGDGVSFRIGVTEGGAYREMFTRHVNPMAVLKDRAWIPVELTLEPYTGRPVQLVLETLAGPAGNPYYDWALWGAPRVVCAG